MRWVLRSHIARSGDVGVVGEAATGSDVIGLVHELEPAIITLDRAMPDLVGTHAREYVLREAPRPVVIVSALDPSIADPALNAMVSGAVDFVPKPSGAEPEETAAFGTRLYQALRAASVAHLLNLPRRRLMLERRERGVEHDMSPARCAVGLAASTGGPRALMEIVPRLPEDMPAAVFIVQHMPPLFTSAFARRLDQMSAVPVREAEHDEVVQEGVVYIARGGMHLDLRRDPDAVRVRLTHDAPLWNVRPAADILLRAIARTFGPASVGAVLTGMGRDGAEGLRAIGAVGGSTLVQDEESCVIASMPRAAAAHARYVLPVVALGEEIVRQARRRARARP
jgi:two-component system chemotaxis response regulator CheB